MLAELLATAESGCVLKYDTKWPHCHNLDGCFGSTNVQDAMTHCMNTPNCDGFSFSANAQNGGGCYKQSCYPDDSWNGFGSGSHGYYECTPDEPAPGECVLRYSKKWPHCNNDPGCFNTQPLENAKAACIATSSCDGFSWTTGASSGSGCYKGSCDPDDSWNGYGYDTHDYYECGDKLDSPPPPSPSPPPPPHFETTNNAVCKMPTADPDDNDDGTWLRYKDISPNTLDHCQQMCIEENQKQSEHTCYGVEYYENTGRCDIFTEEFSHYKYKKNRICSQLVTETTEELIPYDQPEVEGVEKSANGSMDSTAVVVASTGAVIAVCLISVVVYRRRITGTKNSECSVAYADPLEDGN